MVATDTSDMVDMDTAGERDMGMAMGTKNMDM